MLGKKITNFFCEMGKDFTPKSFIDAIFDKLISNRIASFDNTKDVGVGGFKTGNCKLEKKVANYTAKFITITILSVINMAINSVINQAFDENIRAKDPEPGECVKEECTD